MTITSPRLAGSYPWTQLCGLLYAQFRTGYDPECQHWNARALQNNPYLLPRHRVTCRAGQLAARNSTQEYKASDRNHAVRRVSCSEGCASAAASWSAFRHAGSSLASCSVTLNTSAKASSRATLYSCSSCSRLLPSTSLCCVLTSFWTVETSRPATSSALCSAQDGILWRRAHAQDYL